MMDLFFEVQTTKEKYFNNQDIVREIQRLNKFNSFQKIRSIPLIDHLNSATIIISSNSISFVVSTFSCFNDFVYLCFCMKFYKIFVESNYFILFFGFLKLKIGLENCMWNFRTFQLYAIWMFEFIWVVKNCPIKNDVVVLFSKSCLKCYFIHVFDVQIFLIFW